MKKLLIIGGIGIAALSIFGFKKISDYSNVIDQLTVRPAGIADLFSGFNLNVSRFKLKLRIDNPTDLDFNISTIGLITIKKVLILNSKGELLATTTINSNQINIPAKGFTITEWLPIEIATLSTIQNLLSGSGIDPQDFIYKVEINIAGAGDYIIG